MSFVGAMNGIRKVFLGCFRILWEWCCSRVVPSYPVLNTAEIKSADLNQADSVADCLAPWETVGDKRNRRFHDQSKPDRSIWIERKMFSVFPLIPGRSIRITEMLADRSFMVDFKSNEIPWLIGALREAAKVNSGADFSKKTSCSRRHMVCSTVTNRAGVYFKLICSYGGDNRRILHIPAGVKGEGWRNLANSLANFSVGAKSGTKKSKVAKAAKGKMRWKEKITADEGWKEGFLPDLLRFGLKASFGEPSSSMEATRRFAWKSVQSEHGSGTTVVEISPRGDSSSKKIVSEPKAVSEDMKIFISSQGGCSVGFTGGDGPCKHRSSDEDGGDEDALSVKGADTVGVSTSGKANPVLHKAGSVAGSPISITSDSNIKNTAVSLAGGPHSSRVVQNSYGASRVGLSFEEHSGISYSRVKEQQCIGLGFGKGQEFFGPIHEDPVKVDKSWAIGLGNGLDADKAGSVEIIGRPCRPRWGCTSVGPRKESGPIPDWSMIADGSGPFPVNWTTISEEVSKLPPYVR